MLKTYFEVFLAEDLLAVLQEDFLVEAGFFAEEDLQADLLLHLPFSCSTAIAQKYSS